MFTTDHLRSLLYVPADQAHMMRKAMGTQADAIIFDLEDAVADSKKAAARKELEQFMPYALSHGKEIMVRVNDINSEFFPQDLALIAGIGVQTMILPKAEKGKLKQADRLLCKLGDQAKEIKIIPLIETPSGLVFISDILSESDRVITGQLGAEDLTKELEIPRTSLGQEIAYARHVFMMACRAFHLGAIDTPYINIKDLDGLRNECRMVKNMGFTAKTCIHPAHIETINQIFCPTQDEIEISLKIVQLANENKNSGAFAF